MKMECNTKNERLLLEQLHEFDKLGYKLIYVTNYGSKLYGTNNASSDDDFKGIFIPSKESVLLKQDIDHWTYTSGEKCSRNCSDDVDIQLFSIYKFFNLLKKGETGAIDVLFSMFRQDTVVFQDKLYIDHIKMHYKSFLNRNLHSFVGYCVGQSSKYGIKGAKYNELEDFHNKLSKFYEYYSCLKLTDINGPWQEFKKWIVEGNYKYIKFVIAPGPRGSGSYEDIEYIEILGSKFNGDISVAYLYERTSNMYNKFGERAKLAAEGIDWKALSHAVRVILEVEEMLNTGFIKFPLEHAEYIKDIKYSKIEIDEVLTFIESKIEVVNKLLLNSALPEESDTKLIDKILLNFINIKD